MNKASFIKQYTMIQKSLAHFQMEDIEQGIFRYALTSTSLPPIRDDKAQQVALILRSYNFDTNIESIITLFELLINPDEKGVKGIVFTPKYIADYIVQTVLSDSADWNPHMTIIDPSCGCGIFMISALEILHKKFHIPFRVLIEKHVFGADIDKTNIRRCTFILKLLAARHGEYITELPHLKHIDSLKENWEQIFGVPNFTYIIGNPPYVNPHDLPQQTADFLKASFQTTRSGTYNIFYAFIEQSMKYLNTCGTLGFIIPNNFLTIKSAHALREYLQKNSYLKKILDFHYNMVFKPTRTYNCLLFLDRKKRQEFNYATMEKTDSIKNSLKSISFHTMSTPLRLCETFSVNNC